MQNRKTYFEATKVEIKGWVRDWAKRAEQGLQDHEVVELLDAVLTGLDPDMRSLGGLLWRALRSWTFGSSAAQRLFSGWSRSSR